MDNIDKLLEVINATKYPQNTLKWMVYLLENHPSIATEMTDRKRRSSSDNDSVHDIIPSE